MIIIIMIIYKKVHNNNDYRRNNTNNTDNDNNNNKISNDKINNTINSPSKILNFSVLFDSTKLIDKRRYDYPSEQVDEMMSKQTMIGYRVWSRRL